MKIMYKLYNIIHCKNFMCNKNNTYENITYRELVFYSYYLK